VAEKDNRKRDSSALKWMGGVATALVVAVVGVVGTGLGSGLVDAVKSDPPLVTSSETQSVHQCGTPLFVADPQSTKVAADRATGKLDWPAFHRRFNAVIAQPSVVELSIQGESARPIVLTRADFEVVRHRRPQGAIFSNPCGDSINGRSLQVDLDRRHPVVVRSVADPDGVLGVLDESGEGAYRPIRFPWTVSLEDPLILKIVATTKRCDCTWRGSITWKSGERTGRIPVDNDGKGYRVVGIEGVRWYRNENDGWQRFVSQS
jgi:hypothetical protein